MVMGKSPSWGASWRGIWGRTFQVEGTAGLNRQREGHRVGGGSEHLGRGWGALSAGEGGGPGRGGRPTYGELIPRRLAQSRQKRVLTPSVSTQKRLGSRIALKGGPTGRARGGRAKIPRVGLGQPEGWGCQ